MINHNKIKISITFILIIIYIIIFFHIIFIFKKYMNDLKNDSLLNNNIDINNFVFNAHYGILTKGIPKRIKTNPEISVVIPMMNVENYIHRTILSIQNQNFTNFEIIIINDNSIDYSYKIVKKLSDIDHRIKIINNTQSMGTLYSRSIGVLMSKGKYIFPIDSDDLFLVDDILFSVLNEFKKNKIDMIKFRGIHASSINDFLNNKNLTIYRNRTLSNNIEYQPKIFNNSYRKCILWLTAIISALYKNVIDIYGKRYFKYHISCVEDCIINFFIHKLAKSSENFSKIGYLHINRPTSSTRSESALSIMKSRIYYLDLFFQNEIKLLNKLLALKDLYKIIKSKNFILLMKDNKMKIFVKSMLKKIITDKYIPNLNKSSLTTYYNIFI